MEVKKLGAHTLSYDLRQLVIEECKKQAKITVGTMLNYVLYAGLCAVIGGWILSFIREHWYCIFVALPFLCVPFWLARSFFIYPSEKLKLAEMDDYQYYIGTLTDKWCMPNTEGESYYLFIDKDVRFSCERKQFNNVVIGERYILVYFYNNRSPNLLVHIPQKDMIEN